MAVSLGPNDRSSSLRAGLAGLLVVALVPYLVTPVAGAAIDERATQTGTLEADSAGDKHARPAIEAAGARYRETSSAHGRDRGHAVGAIGERPTGAAAGAGPLIPIDKVVPTTPAGCGPATATFTQSTPTAIPSGPAVVTSTLVVSGAGPYLFDLDATTFIRHTYSADLDVTLMSPAGTVVTLTTDNSLASGIAGEDDVFNGTLWDDDADPDGQVPHAFAEGNPGVVTDHNYTNGVLASPLVPEEAMAAFIGEDPNGTWTLTVSDDGAGDGGSVDSWSLAVTTFGAPPNTASLSATQSTPVTISGTGTPTVSSTLVIAGAGTSLLDLDATTFITHTFSADLQVTLMSPAGTVVTLTSNNSLTTGLAGHDDVYDGTVWDDDANPGGQVPYTTNNGLATDHAYADLTLASPLVPEEAMGAFIGEDPNGTWTLTIADIAGGDGGTLESWTLEIDTFTCSADLSVTKTDGVTTATPGGSVTYTIVASNAGPGAANPASVTDTFPAACTGVSYTSAAAGGASGNTAGPAAGNINDAALDLPAGSSVTYTATCTIGPGATGTLVNTATVASATPDPDPANNSDTDTDTLVASSADLELSKTLTTAPPISVGDNVVFGLTVTNNGPSGATGVVVTDTLPAGLTYVSNDCAASFAAPILTWNVGALGASASATCNLTVTVTQPGTLVNTAAATGNEADPTPADNADTAAVVVQQSILEVPTLGGASLAVLMLLLAGLGLAFVRRLG